MTKIQVAEQNTLKWPEGWGRTLIVVGPLLRQGMLINNGRDLALKQL